MEVCFKNFRAFEDTGLVELKKITLLVGENSSGKTSFLAGLNHLFRLLDDNLDADLNSPPFELGSFKDVLCSHLPKNKKKCFEYKYKVGSILCHGVFENEDGDSVLSTFFVENIESKAKITLDYKKLQSSFEMPLSDAELELLREINKSTERHRPKFNFKPGKLLISQGFRPPSSLSSAIGRMDSFRRYISFEIEVDDAILQVLTRIDNELNVLYKAFRRGKLTIALAPMRSQPSRIYTYGQPKDRITPDGSHMPSKLLKRSKGKLTGEEKRLGEIFYAFGKEAGLFEEISTESLREPSNYPFSIMVKTSQGTTSNIMDVGYGVSQILPVILDIIYSSSERERMFRRHGERFLLQQPEVHLHPRAQAAFGSLLAELAKEENKEFIVESHSDFILDRLKYEIKEGNISKDDVGILFFDTEEKKTKIWQIDLNEKGLPESLPESYRRFFLDEGDKVWS